MKFMNCCLLCFVTLFLSVPVFAAEENEYLGHPGFVDFSQLGNFTKDASVEIFLGKPILDLVAALTEEEDPALTQLLGKMVMIRVEEFTVTPEQQGDMQKLIDQTSRKLTSAKWEKLIKVREEDEQVDIFLKTQDSKVLGMLVMTFGANHEAVFINLIGEIDLALIGKLGKKFNIDVLETVATVDKEKTDEKP